jgi:hypothetical protein
MACLPLRPFNTLDLYGPWLASTVLVFALAEVGHIAAITVGHGGAHTAMSMLALVIAALVALFAAYFATRGS